MNEEYAIQIARDWNVPASGSGFVTKFAVKSSYLQKHEVQNVADHGFEPGLLARWFLLFALDTG